MEGGSVPVGFGSAVGLSQQEGSDLPAEQLPLSLVTLARLLLAMVNFFCLLDVNN